MISLIIQQFLHSAGEERKLFAHLVLHLLVFFAMASLGQSNIEALATYEALTGILIHT